MGNRSSKANQEDDDVKVDQSPVPKERNDKTQATEAEKNAATSDLKQLNPSNDV
jgi:hypothetical protein